MGEHSVEAVCGGGLPWRERPTSISITSGTSSLLMAGAAPPSVATEGTAGRGRVGGGKGGRGKAEGGAWGEGGGKRKKVGEVRSRKGLQTSFSLKKSKKTQKNAILRSFLRFSLRFCNKRWGEPRRNAKGRER